MPPTPTAPPRALLQSKPRRVRLVLRDGAEVEGGIFLNDGQALAPYLGTRKGGWVNLVSATWISPVEETVTHAVLQADHVLFAYGPDGDIPVHGVAGTIAVRAIEVTLSDGRKLAGQLCIADRQRLSDFLHTVGKFIPIVGARNVDDGVRFGDVALNHAAVRVLRDTNPSGRATQALDMRTLDMTPPIGSDIIGGARTPPAGATPAKGSAALPPSREVPRPSMAVRPGTATPGGTPQVRNVPISVPGAAYTLEVPGPNVERRSGGHLAIRPSVVIRLDDDALTEATVSEAVDIVSPYSPAVTAIAERAARHWLSLVAERFGLAPADPRRLTAETGTAELWDGIARANELTADELAVHVAATFRLPIARLDAIAIDAVRELAEDIARQHGVIPMRTDAKHLVLACSDPMNLAAEDALRQATKKQIVFEVAPPLAILGATDWWYSRLAVPDVMPSHAPAP